MGKFINTNTQVVVSVSDEKDDRFGEGWELVAEKPQAKPRSKKSE